MDISEVAPGLYIASRFYPGAIDGVAIDCCASLIDDESDQESGIEDLAEAVCALAEDKPERNVVLICDAGRNRSAVVAARALMLSGYSAEEAIKAVRNARESALGRSGGALTNQAFVHYLMTSELVGQAGDA